MATDRHESASRCRKVGSAERPASLGEDINAATRQIHAKLNRLVIASCSLALPPHTSSPRQYFSGLASFAEVYRRFESLWWSSIDQASSSSAPHCASWLDCGRDGCGAPPSNCESRIRGILTHLYPVDLLRTECLDADLSYAPGSASEDCATRPWRSRLHLQAFLAHIETTVIQKPHVLIAYAWVLYMALFSGGRWICAQLLSAGPDFWTRSGAISQNAGLWPSDGKASGERGGLSFFHFHGPEDGEPLKRDFKRRLVEVEAALTVDERRDIVVESQQIFRYCILLVEELHSLHATNVLQPRPCEPSTSLATTKKLAPTPPLERLSSYKPCHENRHLDSSLPHKLPSRLVSLCKTVRSSFAIALLLLLCVWLSCHQSFPLLLP